jgi:hypothetical protein
VSKEIYTVPEGIRRLRADKALALAFPDHSRTALQRAFDIGREEAGLVERPDLPISGLEPLAEGATASGTWSLDSHLARPASMHSGLRPDLETGRRWPPRP